MLRNPQHAPEHVHRRSGSFVWIIARFVTALVLLLVSVRISEAGEPLARQATPPPPRHDQGQIPAGLPAEIAERIRSATSIRIYQVKGPTLASCGLVAGSSDNAILCQPIESVVSSPGAEWSRSIADVLASGVNSSEWRVADAYHPEFAVRFQSGSNVTDVLLSMKQEHFLFVSTGFAPVQGYPRAPRLKYLRLLAEAWPEDQVIHAMLRAEERKHEPRERPTSSPLPPLWPDCELTAGEGEFVYYEEEPVPIDAPQPDFPRGATATHGGGKVVLHVFVDSGGRVCYAKAIQGEPPFITHAIDTVKRWVFKPATSNGRPVGVWVEIPFQIR